MMAYETRGVFSNLQLITANVIALSVRLSFNVECDLLLVPFDGFHKLTRKEGYH
jgi:hypothetical protein